MLKGIGFLETFGFLLALTTVVLGAAAPRDSRPVVLLVIAPEAYSESELKSVQAAFSPRKVHCLIGSTQGGEAKGMVQGTARVEVLLEQVQPVNLDALVLVGGSGAKMYLWFNPDIKRLVKGLHKIHRPIGAVSIAPAALVYAGVLKGRRASVLPAPETLKLFSQNNVELSRTEVTVDGNLVTCSTSSGAAVLAQAVARQLPRKTHTVPLELPPEAPLAKPKPTAPLPARR